MNGVMVWPMAMWPCETLQVLLAEPSGGPASQAPWERRWRVRMVSPSLTLMIRALLAAMLKRKKPEESGSGYVFPWGIYAEHPAAWFGLFSCGKSPVSAPTTPGGKVTLLKSHLPSGRKRGNVLALYALQRAWVKWPGRGALSTGAGNCRGGSRTAPTEAAVVPAHMVRHARHETGAG